MKPLSRALFAFASAFAAAAALACGGPSQVEPSTPQLIPVQPAQPSVVASSSGSARKAEAPRASIPFKCDGGMRFQVGTRTYCAHAEPDTWEASERRCVANGGHLMALDTAATSEAAHKALGSPHAARRAAWIGLELKNKKKPGPNEWKWSSGDAVKTPSWNDSEPNS